MASVIVVGELVEPERQGGAQDWAERDGPVSSPLVSRDGRGDPMLAKAPPMATSRCDLSVPTFLQTVTAVAGFLDRAAAHCAQTGPDLPIVAIIRPTRRIRAPARPGS